MGRRGRRPRKGADLSLGHAVKGVEGAYQFLDLLAARATVMEEWGQYVCGESAW